VGSKTTGYNEIQKRIVDNNGTQCGWCTPGMVMNMYSLLLEEPKPSKKKIESHFDGHICRCTGYRSILDAMKSFAADEKPIDIEELYKLKCLNTCSDATKNKNGGASCAEHQHVHVIDKKKDIHVIRDGNEWFRPTDLDQLLKLIALYAKYRIVSGNTGKGVYKEELQSGLYVDPKQVTELYKVTFDSKIGLTVGCQVTIKQIIDLFNQKSTTSGFEYLSEIAKHLSKVANVAVRNTATWAGNLVLKHDHLSFTSDVFTCLETVGASLSLKSNRSGSSTVSPLLLLNTELATTLIYSVTLPYYNATTTIVKTYKVMPR
jgi:xanthine dehydrogenase/oxidase